METKIIIDQNGNLIDYVNIKNGIIECYSLKEGEQLVPTYRGKLIKPHWNGSEWIEGATEEEIKAWQEENTTTEKEPSTEEILIKEIANLKIEIMQLKGGNA